MKCEVCQQSEATIIFTRVAGDHKKSLHLCSTCAGKEADRQSGESSPPSSDTGADQAAKDQPTAAGTKVNVVVGHLSPTRGKAGPRCSHCGTTYEEFRKVGRFGCAHCYDAFAPQLKRLFKRIHGAQVHAGKGPAPAQQALDPSQELSQLRRELQDAVAKEAYERAADLRDRIAQLGLTTPADPATDARAESADDGESEAE